MPTGVAHDKLTGIDGGFEICRCTIGENHDQWGQVLDEGQNPTDPADWEDDDES